MGVIALSINVHNACPAPKFGQSAKNYSKMVILAAFNILSDG
jgi:hypothetical protein